MSEKTTLRVLLSAYACEPGRGSEPGVGWNMAKALSSKVKLSVATRANNQPIIEECGEEWVSKVEWIYYDPPAWMMWWKKGGRGVQVFYILWQIGLYIQMRFKGASERFDLVHHVTFGKYWIPTLLVLLGVPTVFGSVGGGEYTPANLRPHVSKQTIRSEKIKKLIVWLCTANPVSRYLYSEITLAYAATEQTKSQLLELNVQNVRMLPQSGISSDEMDHFAAIGNNLSNAKRDADFVMCSAARLIAWKGVDLAILSFIKALPALPENSLFKIASDGPQLEYLKSIVNKAGVENKVQFLGRLPSLNDVFYMMASSDCLIHAATGEAFGQACAESLAVGTPVICWNWAGPGLIVDQSCGVAVDPSCKSPIDSMAEAIISLCVTSREIQVERKADCMKRVKNQFLWDEIGETVDQGYLFCLKS